MRVVWTRALGSQRALDSLLTFVDVGALNALATEVSAPARADSLGLRNAWRATATRLQATSLRWFPAIALAELRPEGAAATHEVDARGDTAAVWCGLDSLFWRAALRPASATPRITRGYARSPSTVSRRPASAPCRRQEERDTTRCSSAVCWRATTRRWKTSWRSVPQRCARNYAASVRTCGSRSAPPRCPATGSRSACCAGSQHRTRPSCCGRGNRACATSWSIIEKHAA